MSDPMKLAITSASSARARSWIAFAATLVVSLLACGPAFAQAGPPSIKMESAPLVQPSAARTFYGTATTHTVGPGARPSTAPEIVALARSLGSEQRTAGQISQAQYVANVVTWVRNNVEIEFRYGLSKGAVGALIDLNGSAFDQAELAVDLLRQGGVTATFQLGDIAMTPQQFGHWTGLVKSLTADPSANVDPYGEFTAQSFSVDAKSACQLLADGGIPATVNGQSNCTSVSGDLTSVTLSHVWVVVGGQVYDPSLKAHLIYGGIDLPAAMRCGTEAASTCGTHMVNTTGVTTGTTPQGATTISSPDTLQDSSDWSTRSGNLVNAIMAGGADRDAVKVVGGKELAPSTVAATFITSSVTHTASGPTITGDLPDQYRTTLEVVVPTTGSCRFFGDELAGQRLLISGIGDGVTQLSIEGRPLAQGPPEDIVCPNGTDTVGAGHILMAVNHPYAANGGGYADRSVDFPIVEPAINIEPQGTFLVDGSSNLFANQLMFEHSTNGSFPMVLVHGFGDASASTGRDASDLNEVSPLHEPLGIPCIPSSSQSITPSPCPYSSMALGTEQIRERSTAFDKLVGGVTNSSVILHDQIGLVYSGRNSGTKYITISAAYSFEAQSSSDGGAPRRAFELIAAGQPAIESNTINDYARALQNGDPILKARPGSSPALMVAPAVMSSVLANVQPPDPILLNGTPTNPGELAFETQWRQRLQSAADNGFTVMMDNRWAFNDGEVFIKDSGNDHELSYLFWGAVKGGQVEDPLNSAMTATEVARDAKVRPDFDSVSLADGDLSFSPPPDLVTGSGNFPYSLSFQRTYGRSQALATEISGFNYQIGPSPGGVGSMALRYTGPDQEVSSRIGGNWTHNFNVSASYTYDLGPSVGEGKATNAAWIIAALVGMNDFARLLATNPSITNRIDLLSFQKLILPVTVVEVKKGAQSEMFTYLANNQYDAQEGGAVLGGASALGITPPANVSSPEGWTEPLVYVGKDGDRIFFGRYARMDQGEMYASDPHAHDPSYWCDLTFGGPVYPQYTRANQVFLADAWTWPNGVEVDFSYDNQTFFSAIPESYDQCHYTTAAVLKKVSNNVGRSLNFTYHSVSGASALYFNGNTYSPVNVPTGYSIDTVKDENGRTVTFTRTGCDTMEINCATLAVTDPANATTTYRYAPTAQSPDPATPMSDTYRLRSWSAPSTPASNTETITYDEFYRVKKVVDINNVETDYFPGGLLGGETYKPGRRHDAIGEASTVFDANGGTVRSDDGVGNITRTVLDGFKRPIRQMLPEGGEKRTTYDARGNVLETRSIAKPGSGLSDAVASSTYVEAATVLPMQCVNRATCNQVASDTDANLNTTNYSWNAATGTLSQVLKPSVHIQPDNVDLRPQTDLGYTAIGGISFLTSKTEKIDSTRSAVTAYAYNSANHDVLDNVTVTADGTSEKTCLKFDSSGNLISSTKPKGTTGGCP